MCTGYRGEIIAVATYRALRLEGRSRREIEAGVREGSLIHLRRGVYAAADACEHALRAATHGGGLACLSAARHLGLWTLDPQDGLPRSTHVWVPAHGQTYAHTPCRCVAHWNADSGPPGPFLVASAGRSLLHIRHCAGLEAFFVGYESALRQGLLTSADRRLLHEQLDAAARDLMAFAHNDADSGLESLVRLRLRPFGLSVRTQASIFSVGRVDLLIGERLIIEIDGRANHDGPSLRHKDLVRDAYAAAWGYVTLRFDYSLVMSNWDLVERAILAQALTAR